MKTRQRFIQALRACIGAPYRYGGQDLLGFDCSGLVIFCLHAAGVKIADTTAAGLYQKYKNSPVSNGSYKEGCLLFYGDSIQKISHVMIVISVWSNRTLILAGARGGGAATKTLDKARAVKAFVDVCFGDYDYTHLQAAVDPFKEEA